VRVARTGQRIEVDATVRDAQPPVAVVQVGMGPLEGLAFAAGAAPKPSA
jgi:hypothetical protein